MKKILVGIIAFMILSSAQSAYAAEAYSFKVAFQSENAIVGEALDFSITAMDEDNNVVEDYDGSVLVFSQTDPKAVLSDELEYSVYDFRVSDNGSVMFKDGITFNTLGEQDIYVYDLDDETDSILGFDTVTVQDSENTTSFTIENDSQNGYLSLTDMLNEQMQNNQMNQVSEPSSSTGFEGPGITTTQSTATEKSEVTYTKTAANLVLSSFRKKREYNRGITRTVTQSQETSEEESMKEKVKNMIVSSFRKAKKFNTGISRTVTQSEETNSTQEKVVNMIKSSFRKVRTFNTGISRTSNDMQETATVQ